MFLSTLVRRLEDQPDKDAVLKEAVRQLQEWLGVESSLLRSVDHQDTSMRVGFTEAPDEWVCRIRVADQQLEFRHPSPPVLSPTDKEGLEGFAEFLEDILASPELSPELFSQEEQVQGLIDTSIHLHVTASAEGKITAANPRDTTTRVGTYLWEADWLLDEDREAVKEAVVLARQECTASTLQVRSARNSPYELLVSPLIDEKGEVCTLTIQGRDVAKRHRMREVFLEEREFLRAVLESIDEAIIVCDFEGVVTLVNAAAKRRFGLRRGDCAHESLVFLTSAGGTPERTRTPLNRVLGGEKLREARVVCLDIDEDVRLMNASGCGLTDAEGKPYGAVLALQDTTQRQLAENALAQSERQHRALFNSQPSALFSMTSEGVIVRCNPAVWSLLGYTPEVLEGRTMLSLVHDSSQLELNFLKEKELQFIRSDGSLAWGLARTVQVRDAEGDLGLMWLVTDISKEKRVQRELDISNRKLAESREMERTRLARELHDDAVQNLLAVSYRIQDRELRKEVVGVVQQLRELISDLRPPGLKEFGLEMALEGLLDKIRRQIGSSPPEFELDCGELSGLPEAVSVCVFRVVQESLANVVRHAQASTVRIWLRIEESEVRLEVTDNGVGFEPPKRLEKLAKKEKFGLAGLKERIALVKGRLQIESTPKRGTSVRAQIPLRLKARSMA